MTAREPGQPNLLPPDRTPPAGSDLPLTVSQVTALVKQAITVGVPATVHVVGQISNFKRHTSGHLYLTLKDANSELACVMWRADAGRLRFVPTDGLEVVATGSIDVFERSGRYQLYIRRIDPRGVGALELAYRQLRDKLQAEGLFDPRHKQPLPTYPRRIAVVTSPTGAAVADVLRTITRRYPSVEVLVYPVRVQGPGSADEIARAIRRLNEQSERLGGVDVMIVGRGGGSLEDLWSFNEERVARAIHASRIPVVSAVGHETDYTIADLVADVRAATPTAAAELVVPVLTEVLGDLQRRAARLDRARGTVVALASARLASLMGRRWYREPLLKIRQREQRIDEALLRMDRRVRGRLDHQRARLDEIAPLLQRIAPHAFLLRTGARLDALHHRLDRALDRLMLRSDAGLRAAAARVDAAGPMRALPRQVEHMADLRRRLAAAVQGRMAQMRLTLAGREELLSALSHHRVLARGFSITRLKRGRRIVRQAGDVRERDRVITETADGTFESQVVDDKQMELFE
jgi:exodeoxyribonuclease VII large subunit